MALWNTASSKSHERPAISRAGAPAKMPVDTLVLFYHCNAVTKKATPKLNRLFDRIEQVCSNKSELARSLGVTSTHIQKWITAREYEPGGEITLRLLEWVQAEEAKQTKSPARVRSASGAKTRKRKSSYEKPQSSPR